jgi:anti-sigma factor RsiW
MTAVERPIGEDELHAYVDGFLGPERRQTVERYLADHPEAAARIAGWQAVGAALREAAAWKFQEPVPASLNIDRLAEARIAHRWGAWRMAAGIIVALGVGAGAGWVARGPGKSDGAASAGKELAAANGASRTQSVQLAASPAQLEGQVSGRSGGVMTPPDLSKSGYRLVGGQAVASGQGPACTLTYADAQGTRITLFMPPVQKPDTSGPRLAEAGRGNGGSAPQAADAGGGNGARVPQLAEAGGGNGGTARFAEAGGGDGGRAPQLAEASGGAGRGATTAAPARGCP